MAAVPKVVPLSHDWYVSVVELSRALVAHTSVADLVEDLTNRLHQISDYSYVAVLVYDEENDAMRMHAVC
jgi:transcriptional regulator with GAF, ATPase, and Fis domain